MNFKYQVIVITSRNGFQIITIVVMSHHIYNYVTSPQPMHVGYYTFLNIILETNRLISESINLYVMYNE